MYAHSDPWVLLGEKKKENKDKNKQLKKTQKQKNSCSDSHSTFYDKATWYSNAPTNIWFLAGGGNNSVKPHDTLSPKLRVGLFILVSLGTY